MTATALIAGNFVREQRWYVLMLLLWVFGIALLLGGFSAPAADDAMFFIHQQAGYGLALTTFMAAAAIHNDRRSRRILAVLSKAVSRRQYLAGLLLGTLLVNAIFFSATGVAAAVLATQLGWSTAAVWQAALALVLAGALLACLALFFSTFLHPLLATLATAVATAAQFGAERALGATAAPMYGMARALGDFSFQPQWHAPAAAMACAIAETVALWLLAALIFERRDVAVAVE